jgi:hypothetical protein
MFNTGQLHQRRDPASSALARTWYKGLICLLLFSASPAASACPEKSWAADWGRWWQMWAFCVFSLLPLHHWQGEPRTNCDENQHANRHKLFNQQKTTSETAGTTQKRYRELRKRAKND